MAAFPSPLWLVKRRKMFLNVVGVAETLPASVRPSVIIRRRMVSHGLLGKSNLWRFVAIVVLLRRPIEGVAFRQPEHIGRFRMRPGKVMRVSTIQPTTRRQLREQGLSRKQAEKRAYDEAWAEIQDPTFRP